MKQQIKRLIYLDKEKKVDLSVEPANYIAKVVCFLFVGDGIKCTLIVLP